MTADTGADDDEVADSDTTDADDADGAADSTGGRGATDDRVSAGDQESAGERGSDGVDPEAMSDLTEELDGVREDLDDLETRIDEKTVHRDDIRSELRRYVRKRQRRGHATGWGPYLVLLYGTVMTVGAFYYLGDIAAILAMLVIWLSTLGLFVFMTVTGLALGVVRRLGGIRALVGRLRRR